MADSKNERNGWILETCVQLSQFWWCWVSPIFLPLLSNVEWWKGGDMPDKGGTAKLKDKNITYDVSLLPVASPTSLSFLPEDQSVAIPFSRLIQSSGAGQHTRRVINYVLRRKRLSKSERAKEPRSVTYLLKHWKKLKIRIMCCTE